MNKIKKNLSVILNRAVAFITLYVFLFTTVHFPAYAANYNDNNAISYNSSNLKHNQNESRMNRIDRKLTEKLGRVNDKFLKLYNNRENFKSDPNFDMKEDGKLFYLEKYGETIINYMGLTLAIPENSAPKDSYITIIPLTKDELVNIPSDVYNVTYTENGITYIGYDIRLNGSSANKFKKNIEIGIKYNDEVYKDKAIDNAVFIYYFDEENYKWEKINRKSLDKQGKNVTSLTDHFCQFYAGLMSMQTEPPQAKGINTKPINIEAVDPLAGYRGVAPPKPNNKGTANVSYPIVVPEGINGMTPSVSINYSSANKESDCGYGWNLNTSKIEIKTKNMGVPQYNGNEIFLLDDEELVLVDTVNKIYRYKVERDFSKIVKQSDNSFKIFKTDGSILYYGLNDNSRTLSGTKIFNWYLSRIEDKFGNKIEYTYTKYDNTPYLNDIYYGYYNTTNDYMYRINFFWLEKDGIDKRESYIPGFSISKNMHLQYIRIKFYNQNRNETLLKEYNLSYNFDPNKSAFLGKKFLQSVTEKNGTTELNKSSFEYNYVTALGENDYFTEVFPSENIPYELDPMFLENSESIRDINGDGLTDFIHVHIAGSDGPVWCNFKINTGNSFFNGSQNLDDSVNPPNLSINYDINRDGFLDVHTTGHMFNGLNFIEGWDNNRTTGSGDQVSDLNFDGYDDFCALNLVYPYFLIAKVIVNNNCTTSANLIDNWSEGEYKGHFFQDMNGDGLPDLIIRQGECMSNFPEFDFLAINKGGKFDPPTSSNIFINEAELDCPSNYRLRQFTDINNDGLSDLIILPHQDYYLDDDDNKVYYDKIYVMYNIGNNNFSDLMPVDIPLSEPKLANISFLDFKGKGYPDVLIVDRSGNKHILDNNSASKNVLTAITNEKTGVKTELTYDYKYQITDDTERETKHFYKKEYVLTSVKTGLLNAGGTAYTIDTITNIDYEDGVYDRIEREFRGFEKVIATVHDKNKGTDHITETTYAAGMTVKNANGSDKLDDYGINKVYDLYIKDQVTEAVSKIKMPYETEARTLSKVKYDYDKGKVYGDTTTAGYKDIKFPYIKNTYAWLYDYNGVFIGVDELNGDMTGRKEFGFDTTNGLVSSIIETNEGDPWHDLDDTAAKTIFLKSSTQWLNVVNETTAITTPVSNSTVLSNIDFSQTSNRLSNKKYYYDNKTSNTDNTFTMGKLTKEEVWNNNGDDTDFYLQTEYGYDLTYGYVNSITDSGGLTTAINISYNGCETVNGKSISYSKKITKTLPTTLTETSWFNSYGYEIVKQDIYGDFVEMTYDEWGRVESITEKIGTQDFITKKFKYYEKDANGRIAAEALYLDNINGTDDENRYLIMQFIKDGLGRNVQTKKEAVINGATTKSWVVSGYINRDQMGRAKEQGMPTISSFDYIGNSVSYTDNSSDSLSIKTTFEYDDFGRFSTATAPNGYTVTKTYDIDKYAYNSGYRILTSEELSDNHNRVSREYKDMIGNVVKTETKKNTDGDIITDNYTYTLQGHGKVNEDDGGINAEGQKQLTSTGALKWIKSPDAGKTEYFYDTTKGLVTSIQQFGRNITDEENKIINITYDNMNRIKTIDYPDPVTSGVPYSDIEYIYYGMDSSVDKYDKGNIHFVKKGRLTDSEISNDDLTSMTEYSYEQLSISEEKTFKIEGATYTNSTTYTYDVQGRIKEVQYPDNETVYYNYDEGGYLKEIYTDPNAKYMSNILYNERGQRKQVTYGNGVVTDYTYDDQTGLLDTMKQQNNSTTLIDYIYNFDQSGNLESLSDGIKSAQNYSYDLLGRISSSDGSYQNNTNKYDETYSFDNLNRITGKTYYDQEESTYKKYNFIYNTTSHIMNSINIYNYDPVTKQTTGSVLEAITFGYDDYGNMLNKTFSNDSTKNQYFTYNSANKISHINMPDTTKQLNFMYDAGGNRIYKKYTDSANSIETKSIYVNGFYTINKSSPTSAEKASKHISDGQYIIATITPLDTDPDNTVYYTQNNIGSTVLLTDEGGERIQGYYYTPYGQMWAKEDGSSIIDEDGDTIDDRVDRLFTGQMYDKESGLYYMNARYYDPDIGTFMTTDPAMSSLNHYAYASANPIKYTDPTGMFTVQGGYFGTAGCGGGAHFGFGSVISFNFEDGFEYGAYITYGGGGYAGVDAEVGVELGFSLNNNVDDLAGPSVTIGGSGGALISAGGDVSVPAPGNKGTDATPSYSGSLALGVPDPVPGEAHTFITNTHVFNLTEPINAVINTMKDGAKTIIEGSKNLLNKGLNLINNIIDNAKKDTINNKKDDKEKSPDNKEKGKTDKGKEIKNDIEDEDILNNSNNFYNDTNDDSDDDNEF